MITCTAFLLKLSKGMNLSTLNHSHNLKKSNCRNVFFHKGALEGWRRIYCKQNTCWAFWVSVQGKYGQVGVFIMSDWTILMYFPLRTKLSRNLRSYPGKIAWISRFTCLHLWLQRTASLQVLVENPKVETFCVHCRLCQYVCAEIWFGYVPVFVCVIVLRQ